MYIDDRNEMFDEMKQGVDPIQLLGLIEMEHFVVGTLGIEYSVLTEYDSVEGTADGIHFSQEEIIMIVSRTNNFLHKTDDFAIKMVFDVLIFECQCSYAGMRMIMAMMAMHLGIEFKGDC